MVDIIILLIIAVVLVLAVRSSIGHFSGKGDCCGGGSTLVDAVTEQKTKLDGPVLGEKMLKISGMHCDHCASNVAAAINKIDGALAKVDLKTETARVSYDRELNDDDLRRAVEQAGYEVTSISA